MTQSRVYARNSAAPSAMDSLRVGETALGPRKTSNKALISGPEAMDASVFSGGCRVDASSITPICQKLGISSAPVANENRNKWDIGRP